MKKVLIVFLALVFPASVFAMDIPQGKYEITGTTSFGFSSTSIDVDGGGEADVDTIELNLDAQYYFQKNFAVGAFFEYEDVDADLGGDATFWMIGPQATYNISLDEKLSVFLNGGVGYANYEIGDVDADGFGFRVAGGLKYFFTSNIAAVAQLRYTWLSLDVDNGPDVDYDDFGLGIGFSFLF